MAPLGSRWIDLVCMTLEALNWLERCRVYGGHLLLSQLPSLPDVEEQVPTPAGFAKCSVNSHNLKQLFVLKELADVYEHFKTTVAKHRTAFEKGRLADNSLCRLHVLCFYCHAEVVRCGLSFVRCGLYVFSSYFQRVPR